MFPRHTSSATMNTRSTVRLLVWRSQGSSTANAKLVEKATFDSRVVVTDSNASPSAAEALIRLRLPIPIVQVVLTAEARAGFLQPLVFGFEIILLFIGPSKALPNEM